MTNFNKNLAAVAMVGAIVVIGISLMLIPVPTPEEREAIRATEQIKLESQQARQKADEAAPIVECESLPQTASIEGFSNAKTRAVCQEMLSILNGVTMYDLRRFSEYSLMLSVKGYKEEETSIARELVEIIRLRGLSNNEPSWESTNDLSWRLWIVEKGLISPRTIREFLASAGPEVAKSITDHALLEMMITIAVAHKNGVDLDEPD
jgi:hypothetical protein